MRGTLRAALSLALALACAAPAAAQGPGESGAGLGASADEAEARSRFFTGAQLYQEGDYEGALAEFRKSYELRRAAVVSFNIAQTLRALHRYHEAVQVFERYLREARGEISAARRAQVQRTIRALKRRIAPITLKVQPAGAEIRIDGREVGEAPLGEPLMLGAGRRVVEVTADGYVSVRDELEVVGRQPRTVEIRLAKKETAGTIDISSEPDGAEVRIDGLEVGEAPVERKVPRGGHVIEASLEGYELYREPVEIAPRQSLSLNVVLEEEQPPGLVDRWWFWAGVSALVIGGTIAAIFLAQPDEPDPIPGNSHQQVIEL